MPSHIRDSIIFEGIGRSGTGRKFEGSLRRAPLKIGAMWASLQISGNVSLLSERQNIKLSGVARIELLSVSKDNESLNVHAIIDEITDEPK